MSIFTGAASVGVARNPITNSPYFQNFEIGANPTPPSENVLLITDGTPILLTDGTDLLLAE